MSDNTTNLDDDLYELLAALQAVAQQPPQQPIHSLRAYPCPDRPETLLLRWVEGGWYPDSAAMLSYHAGNLRLYRLRDADDTIVAVCPANGQTFIYTQISFAERAEIRQVPPNPWIPTDNIRSIWSDELDAVVAADSGGGPPPQPPGAGAAAAAGAESRPAQQQRPAPSEALTALVAAGAMEAPAAAVLQWAPLPVQHHHHYHHHWSAAPVLVPAPAEEDTASLSLILAALAAARAREAAVGPVGPYPSAPPAPALAPLPKHIATIVLERAAADGTLCPITMEPITPSSGVVSSCGHVFQGAALKEWLSGHTTCPECRQPCCI